MAGAGLGCTQPSGEDDGRLPKEKGAPRPEHFSSQKNFSEGSTSEEPARG
jgi:hypothetical protein